MDTERYAEGSEDLPPGGSAVGPVAWSPPSALSVILSTVALCLVGVGVAAATQWRAAHDPHVVAGLRVLGHDVGGLAVGPELHGKLQALVAGALDTRVTLSLGSGAIGEARPRTASRRQLGMRIDDGALEAQVVAFGRGGVADPEGMLGGILDRLRARRGAVDLVPMPHVDHVVAREFFVDLKDDVDRAAVDAHLDLDHHRVASEQPGCLLKVYDALVAVDYLAQAGLGGPTTLSLGTSSVPARVTADKLAQIDISTVLGTWETRYSAVGPDTDRTYNLKVGADHLNGHILMPGELFSFNEVVGDRTEKEGYRVAPVISAGELVDGLAGGMCQIASTLHAAAFFGGLEIVSSTPHSRPSAYITMGLDSTVVYPTTDLKLRNTYDFPLVMHYTVNQGTVKVELLGKARPNAVVFEREIRAETGFGRETRRDSSAPVGQQLLLQEGYPGYALVRRRFVFPAGQVPKTRSQETMDQALGRLHAKPIARKEWALHYPSTEQIVANGTGPKKLKKKDAPPAHRIPPLQPEQRGVYHVVR
ncbi:MAG: VanW family protein [Polyangia bacterium]